MSAWTHIMDAAEIAEFHALTAKLDCGFARREREFYETRTADQCDVLAHQAWLCNESGSYQLARSYAAMKRAA